MRILLDESLPRDFAPMAVGHEAVTVQAARAAALGTRPKSVVTQITSAER